MTICRRLPFYFLSIFYFNISRSNDATSTSDIHATARESATDANAIWPYESTAATATAAAPAAAATTTTATAAATSECAHHPR